MKTGQTGIALIKSFEGCRLHAYRDSVGVWTIGYGDTDHVSPELQISQQEAEDRLHRRLAKDFEPAVDRVIRNQPRTTQHMYDAMISLAYNIGAHAFAGSSIAHHHAQGYFREAANSFLFWDKSGGRFSRPHLLRRRRERAVYLGLGTGNEDGTR